MNLFMFIPWTAIAELLCNLF